MSFLLDPLSSEFMLRALVGGVLVATMSAIVGTWVVIRGMAFLGEAMAHGMLPGVAIATLLGLPVVFGAAVSALVMSAGVGVVSRRGRLSNDTTIGLLFVGMLALGVIVVSRSRSFAVDLTAILFGDVLAIGWSDVLLLGAALLVTVAVAALFHRPFVALAFDPRIARTLGLRPRLAQTVLTGLVTLAVVASYSAVGTLLVVGLLLAPAVAAGQWMRRIPAIMMLAAAFGSLAVLVGLLVSWHASTAAGASIALTSIVLAAVSAGIRALAARLGAASTHSSHSSRSSHPTESPITA
ncbi:zinc ABC transporter permease AztB [Agreia sp. VKM Ac-1783]|uniref:zinc ABC transporter permease AztB n=1 Tax=Agreia sp. VKM Ac-1783 TaxID=1938889 RepID=UPI000A2AD6FE|nr:zinc ABC transporter permease AztB [Agreia sp. VKM Ac-1783]SMQ71249.1 zinc/manganese transport system permease protein/manganese/iron transport system permease protein [Agreia sp. VKM Ac-1783]